MIIECKKKRYPTKRLALDALNDARWKKTNKGDNKRKEKRIYFCTLCCHWHLTSLTRN